MSRKSRMSYVCCPVCGGFVFRGTMTESEHVCHKCGSLIEAWVKDGVVIIYNSTDESRDESTAHRLSYYLDQLENNKKS